MRIPKRLRSILAVFTTAVMLLAFFTESGFVQADAASSSEIRKQINQLKQEKEALQEKIEEAEAQYKENENEIADLISRKNVIDQQVQLLYEQIQNINDQLATYNLLIADKQEELDTATSYYRSMSEENRARIRTMEEEGTVSYWEVIFKANSFTDLLDRLSMIEEIATADNKHLKEMSDAAEAVEVAQSELTNEKAEVEATKTELDTAQAELDTKMQEALDLLQELLSKADSLEALQAEFQAQDEAFLEEIAAMEEEYSAAKQAEWEAYMATYVPPTTAAAGTVGTSNSDTASDSSSTNSSSSSSSTSSGSSATWLIPCSYTSITSPFGYRTAPTTGASTYHQGVDLDSTTGMPVVATRAGIVTVAGYGSSAGNYVQINHQDGFSSIYMHLNNYCVSAGTIVSAGQQIGTVGATGVATGDHLHFGISYNGVYVNPCNYVNLS